MNDLQTDYAATSPDGTYGGNGQQEAPVTDVSTTAPSRHHVEASWQEFIRHQGTHTNLDLGELGGLWRLFGRDREKPELERKSRHAPHALIFSTPSQDGGIETRTCMLVLVGESGSSSGLVGPLANLTIGQTQWQPHSMEGELARKKLAAIVEAAYIEDDNGCAQFKSEIKDLLERYKEASVKAIQDRIFANSPSSLIVWLCIEALGESKDGQTMERRLTLLSIALESSDAGLRDAAAKALGMFEGAKARHVLSERLRHERNRSVQSMIRAQLE